MDSPQVKTYLFRAFDAHSKHNDEFPADLRNLLMIMSEPAKAEAFRKGFMKAVLARTNLETHDELERVSELLDLPLTTTESAGRCAEFLVKQLTRKECRSDQPADIASDMEKLTLIDDAQIGLASDVMTWVKSHAVPDAKKVLREREAAVGVFPSFKGVSVVTDLRPIQEDSYDTTKRIEDYNPAIEGLIPVFSIQIRTTGEDFSFQADRDEVEHIALYLRAAIKDAEALQQYAARK